MAVNRLAVAAATNSGDPILDATTILSETTISRAPRTEQNLDSGDCVAVDSSGGRYFTYVRSDGRGQIDIRWPNGLEKTIKFWLPEAYFNPSEGETIKENPSHSSGMLTSADKNLPAAGPATIDLYRATPTLVSRHAVVFLLVGFAFAFDLYRVFHLHELGGAYALGSALALGYFLGASYFVRFALARGRTPFVVALVICFCLYFGWACLMVFMSNEPLRGSLLLAACLTAAFKILRFEVSRA